MLARCPSCRNTFTAERAGRQDCPVCGKPLVVPEAAVAAPPGQAPGQPPGVSLQPDDGAVPPGTPWERRAELGFVTAWARTISEALLDPHKLLASARLDRGAAQLGFAVLTTSVFSVVNQLLTRLLFSGRAEELQRALQRMTGGRPLPPGVEKLLLNANSSSPALLLLSALLSPLFALAFVYASAGVTHLFAVIFGQNRRGFPATFAAVAYAFAPFVLVALPGCGWLIAVVWCVVLTGIGMKATHGISTGGAVATALMPYLLLCCAACGASILFGMALAQTMKGMAN